MADFGGKLLHELACSTELRSGTILKIEFRNVVGLLVVALTCEPHVFIGGRLCIPGERVVVTAGHLEPPCAVERLIGFLSRELLSSECFVLWDDLNMLVWRCADKLGGRNA